MSILNDKQLIEINPGVVSPDANGDICLACMRRVAEKANRETVKMVVIELRDLSFRHNPIGRQRIDNFIKFLNKQIR